MPANLAHINAAVQKAIAKPPAPQSSHLLRGLMYALQAYDAINSANAFKMRVPNRMPLTETDPLMRPFSHGGAPTMMAGFALGDIIRDALLRHASPGTQNNAMAAQALSNIIGIGQTDRGRTRVLQPVGPQP